MALGPLVLTALGLLFLQTVRGPDPGKCEFPLRVDVRGSGCLERPWVV